MSEPRDDHAEPMTTLVRREWSTFRSRARLLAMTTAVLVSVLLGVLVAAGNQSSCSQGPVEVPCPTEPVGPDGRTVRDQFTFVHRPLGENGEITVRMTDMTGIITYPPPDHDEIVPGLVPWAKAGIVLKDGVRPGSAYAALMVTGSHGVRMQYGFTEDIAGSPAGVSAAVPRWLRLVRSGATVTGFESVDGARWTEVGTAHLPGLPSTVQVGLFAASPGNLTLRTVGLGGSAPESRFTQTTAAFDSVSTTGAAADGWSVSTVGRSASTDWEKFHKAPGLVETGGTLTVTGSGDIAPAGPDGGHPVERSLVGLPIGMIIVLVLAVRYATGAPPASGRALAARAIVMGSAALAAGLVTAGVVVPVGAAILSANGVPVLATPVPTVARAVLGVGALFGVAAVLALALGALVRRAWVAGILATAAIALPAVLAVLPLPDDMSDWLLSLTPAAGFAVQQTQPEYPQVLAHYAPAGGYFPLPWWAGFAVLCGYAAVGLGLAVLSRPGRGSGTGRRRPRPARPGNRPLPAEPATWPGRSG
jgi:hypothetical protein